MKEESPNSSRRLRAAQRRKEILRLRTEGVPAIAIAARLGLSRARISQVLTQEREKLAQDCQHLRQEHAWYQLELLHKALFALSAAAERGDVKAIRAQVACLTREAALLGLDAPQRTAATLEHRFAQMSDSELLAEAERA